MNELIKQVLLANSSQIGFNWIYNPEFLKEYSKNNNMLMTAPNDEHYHHNKPSYNSYEGAPAGSNSLQGQIIKWLYEEVSKSNHYGPGRYKHLLVNKFSPGGAYVGYVESYGKKLILSELAKDFKTPANIVLDDDQLVGFVPYIVYKALGKSLDEAYELTKVLTNNDDYYFYFEMFDYILESKDQNKQKALNKSIRLAPIKMKEKLENAIAKEDASEFIKDTHDLSCSIDVAMPIILYLYSKHNSLIDALKENVVLGGASADRAIILGLLYYPDILPIEWNKYLE